MGHNMSVRRAGRAAGVDMSEQHAERNQIAALVILEDPQRWGGDSAGLVRWSRLTLARLARADRRAA